ncbi:rhodanese-like domain-containing protein [Sphingobacterium spiritivorum]|uniref:rhodanese-like domain-containing protein n=1 Tax=Sphingobacterium spiritivorum TaxID=258 RepID=UPI003DA2FF90
MKKITLLFMFLMSVFSYSSIADAAQQDSMALSVEQFARVADQHLIIDTRKADDFLKGFVSKSINIGWEGPFDSWMTKVVANKDTKLLLIAEVGQEKLIVDKLHALGYANVIGYLKGGLESWTEAHKPVERIGSVTAAQALEHMRKTEYVYIDVRTAPEYAKGHVETSLHIPLNTSDFQVDTDPQKIYLLQCQSGYRSSLAASLLYAKGIHNVLNVEGGYRAVSAVKDTEQK